VKKLIKKIKSWGYHKGFVLYEGRFQQIAKLAEEVGELASAILKKDKDEQVDAIGDIQVVLILLSEMLGHDYEKCLNTAYDEIKNRTGKVVDGTFIKDEK
jgi:NTP pyrophosphatase (non-canonical NTP hydrolase)